MTMPEVVDFISRFADVSGAPVRTNTNVTSVTRTDDGYRVVTSDGEIRCRCVVLASGGYNVPSVPAVSASLPPDVEQITPFDYRDPSQLADGGVLVVGASATGVQLADEIHRSGRPVTLAVGEHVRLPRRYRGRDVLWWMDRLGRVERAVRRDRRPDPRAAPALAAARRHAGHDARPECSDRDRGRAGRPRLGGTRRLGALLRRAPEHVRAGGPEAQPPAGHLRRVGARPWRRLRRRGDLGEPERFEPTRAPDSSRWRIDLGSGEIRTILWATGFRPDYSWLHVPVVDAKGNLRHDGGVSSTARGWWCSGCPCCAAASRASSTAPRTMRESWWITSPAISLAGS